MYVDIYLARVLHPCGLLPDGVVRDDLGRREPVEVAMRRYPGVVQFMEDMLGILLILAAFFLFFIRGVLNA